MPGVGSRGVTPALFCTAILAMVLTVLSFVPNHLLMFLSDAGSSLTPSDRLFYCLSHLEADSVAAKSPDWSLGQKFGEDGGKGWGPHVKSHGGRKGTRSYEV